jgi:ATP-binding cassette subfamily C protein CydD
MAAHALVLNSPDSHEPTAAPDVAQSPAQAEKRARDRFLRSQTRLARPALATATAAGLGVTLSIVVQSFALAAALYDGAIRRDGVSGVLPWLAVLGAATLSKAACSSVSSWFGAAAAMTIQRELRRELLTALFASERLVADASAPQAAAHANGILEQVDRLESYYARYLPQLWLAVLSPLLFLLAIFPANWIVGVILLVTTPIIPLYMALIGAQANDRSSKQAEAVQHLSSYFLDRLRGLATLQRLNASEREVSRIAATSEDLGERTMDVLNLALVSSAVLEFFSMLSVAITAIYIGFTLLGFFHFGVPRAGMTLQTALFLLLLAAVYFQPLRSFAAAYHDRADALAAAGRLLPLLGERAPNSADGQGNSGLPAYQPGNVPSDPHATLRSDGAAPAIALRGVTLRYAGQSRPALEDVSLEIPVGQMVALTGPSGAGKSSLLSLVAGLATPTEGEMIVAGVPLNEQTRPRVRRSISWIGQRPYLFPGTLAENIAFGQPDAPRSTIDEAAVRARVTDFAASLPAGLDTTIGERGRGISGGEGQRVALARAFLRDTPLLLLDEPTASLDAATEGDVIETILTLARGRTVVVATHSPALIERCERVVRLEAGRVLEISAPRVAMNDQRWNPLSTAETGGLRHA